MNYLFIIPATLIFCIWMYFCFCFLPKQLRTTRIGEKIGPTIGRFTWLFLVGTGLCSIILSLVIIIAPQYSNLSLIARKMKFVIYNYSPVIIGIGFFLFLALVVVLKTLQYFKLIR